MSRKQVYNNEEAVSYLMEELLSEDDGSADLESSDDGERDPDFVSNHYDLVEENPTLSPPLPILHYQHSIQLLMIGKKLKLILRFHSFCFTKGQ